MARRDARRFRLLGQGAPRFVTHRREPATAARRDRDVLSPRGASNSGPSWSSVLWQEPIDRSLRTRYGRLPRIIAESRGRGRGRHQGHRLSRLDQPYAISSSGPNSGPTTTPTAASSSAAPTRRRSRHDCYEVNIFDKRRNRPTAPARSSMSPRSIRCRKPAASGTPMRSRRQGPHSSSCSTASRPSMAQDSKHATGASRCSEAGADKKARDQIPQGRDQAAVGEASLRRLALPALGRFRPARRRPAAAPPRSGGGSAPSRRRRPWRPGAG